MRLPPNATADQEAAYHVGNLSFFGVARAKDPRGDEQAHGLSVTYDLTALAERERASGQWKDNSISVTFKPLGLIPPEGEEPAPAADEEPEPPATIGTINVYYA